VAIDFYAILVERPHSHHPAEVVALEPAVAVAAEDRRPGESFPNLAGAHLVVRLLVEEAPEAMLAFGDEDVVVADVPGQDQRHHPDAPGDDGRTGVDRGHLQRGLGRDPLACSGTESAKQQFSLFTFPEYVASECPTQRVGDHSCLLRLFSFELTPRPITRRKAPARKMPSGR
jgi:hypothetical protein